MRISDWSYDVCSSDLAAMLYIGRAARAGGGEKERVPLGNEGGDVRRDVVAPVAALIEVAAPARLLLRLDRRRKGDVTDMPLRRGRFHGKAFQSDRKSTRLNSSH